MRRRYVNADPCTGLDTCHYWPRHDDRCDRTTEAHSDYCAEHYDQQSLYWSWWDSHAAEDCCPACCEGEIEHD